MITVIFSVGIVLIFFAFLSIRLLLVKDGQFRGTCASQSPFLNPEGETCSYCGKNPSQCENKSKA